MKRYGYIGRRDGGSTLYDKDTGIIVLESVGDVCGELLLDYQLINDARGMTMAQVLSNKRIKQAVLMDCWQAVCAKIESVISEAK